METFIVHNLISQSYPGNLNYTDDSDEEYNRGWNEALKNYQDNLLQQIKNKAPELTETIVNMIVEEIGGFDNVNISLEYKLGKELFRKHLTEQLLKD